MKRESPRPLQYTKRHGQMTAAYSIKDFYDIVEELLTNADDAYHRQFVDGSIAEDGGPILLEIEPHRNAPSLVRVRDRAGGFRDLAKKLELVGERTSLSGDRGFMARGLKDCAAVGHITVETIVDGHFDKAEITTGFELVPYASNRRGGDSPTKEDRSRLGIQRGTGTVAEVAVEPRVNVPISETLRRELPWHYAIRDIMGVKGASKVQLRYSSAQPQLLQRVEPDTETIYDREHEVPGYPGSRFRFTLLRTAKPLEDPTDSRFRRSGIVIKGRRAIYSCSFISSDLERDPAATHYFGRLECASIDSLAEEWDERRERGEGHPDKNPMFIIDPNRRGGLAEEHPFVQALVQLPIIILKEQFEEERKAQANRQREIESKETTERLKKLAREASRFMREKLEDLGSIAPGDIVNEKSFYKSGVGISPVFTQIPVGETKAFVVKVDNRKLDLPPGTAVKVMLSKAAEKAVQLVAEPSDLEPDLVDAGLLKGSFTLRGMEESRRAQVGCQVDSVDPVFIELQVVSPEPKDRDIPGEFAFHRQKYTIRLGGRRTLVLRARFRSLPPTKPTLRFEQTDVALLRGSSSFELVPGTTYYEMTLSVEGRKPNGKTKVVAECAGRTAQCALSVVEREEEGVDLTFQLVSHDLGANYRAVWDRKEPNKLLITTQHESIRRYLGAADQNYPGQNGEAFRTLLAELISDNVCRRIVEEHARAQPHQFDSDKVYLLHNRLMKEFTPIAHQIQLANPTVPA